MESPPLDRLLEDFKKIRRVCRESNLELLPPVAVDYLWKNAALLECIVQEMYATTTEEYRRSLQEKYSSLDQSAISNEFQPIAMEAVENARRIKTGGKGLFVVDEDTFSMLMRVLEYARLCSIDNCAAPLQMSPIEDFGLRLKVRDFKELSQEELRRIPWYLSDISYEEKKRDVLRGLSEQGGDLKNNQLLFKNTNFPDSMDLWKGAILNLLRLRSECDVAAVLLVAPLERPKYTNAFIDRARREFLQLQDGLRRCLNEFYGPWFEMKNGRPMNHFEGEKVENLLEPLRKESEAFLWEIRTLQPRSEIYQAVQANEKKEEIHMGPTFNNSTFGGDYVGGDKVGGDKVMGDKITGQVAAKNMTLQDFNQLWSHQANSVDLNKLATELGQLREAMAKQASVPEQQLSVESVKAAEAEAKKGDGPRVLQSLAKAGKWAVEVATTIGAGLVVEVLKKTLGL